MKKLIPVTLVLLFSFSVIAVEQELILSTQSNGQPNFGIQYAYDVDFSWSFTYTTSISSQTLSTLPKTIYWNLIDLKEHHLIGEWISIDKQMLQVGSLSLSDKAVISKLLPNLNTTKVIYALQDRAGHFAPVFYLNIGPLCQQYASTHFTDLTNSNKKGCEVKADDIPDWQSECKELEEALLNYIKDGLLTCDLAKKQFSKNGCGILECQ